MKIVRNSLTPFKGFKAINLFGVLFVRKECTISKVDLNHEMIHTVQIKALFYLFFYLWYVVEWLIRLCMPGNAYDNISFEKEAYENEKCLSFLQERKSFNFLKYLRNGKN
ncbi:MAG: hypothetical protein LIP01_14990 [Tannerellaceae bacterium]|nr:hypothetical protein [Tannerellaceae bacterium]